ncbi:hypothetical protein EJB05_08246, partial [Eragrostis curvula]
MIADLIAAGDQVGCMLLTMAAIPLRCGVDIDVPDSMKKERLASSANCGCSSLGAQAARMFMPGPVMSGLRIPGLALFGPRDEKNATDGAGEEPITVPRNVMVAVGLLTCEAGSTCASAKVVYPSAALFIRIMPAPPYAATVWPCSTCSVIVRLSQSTTLPRTSSSTSELQPRASGSPFRPGNTSGSWCPAVLFRGWNSDSPSNTCPFPSLTVVRIARSMVPAATVSIHGAPLPMPPATGPSLPAAALTKMPCSMALNVAVATRS